MSRSHWLMPLGSLALFLAFSSCSKPVTPTSEMTEAEMAASETPESRAAKADTAKTAKAEEDNYPKTITELKAFIQSSPHADKYNAGIIPQMMEDAPEYALKLIRNKFDHFIVVDKARMSVILFDKYGCEVKSYPCACGRGYGHKVKKGDCRTPEGFLHAEGIYDSTNWLYTNDAGYTSPARGQFGPRYIRVQGDKYYPVGIHGTGAPWSRGHRASHGCIRLSNQDILELAPMARPGMPIIITPSKPDQAANAKNGIKIASISTIPGKPAGAVLSDEEAQRIKDAEARAKEKKEADKQKVKKDETHHDAKPDSTVSDTPAEEPVAQPTTEPAPEPQPEPAPEPVTE